MRKGQSGFGRNEGRPPVKARVSCPNLSEIAVSLRSVQGMRDALAMRPIQTLSRYHPSFPTSLRDIPRWPDTLDCHGRLLTESPMVAIVGARAASGRAMKRAAAVAEELSNIGAKIISGGALGVDTAAHQGVLAAGGYTVAVMACGLDQYYPRRNQALFEAILERGGAVVSPYAQGAKPLRGRFVRRNQVIAALADLVLVVEAGTHSGSLHTARFASALGRKLAVVAGSPGCEALRASGVPAIESASEVMAVLAGTGAPPVLSMPCAGSAEARVLEALSAHRPASASDLHAELGVPLRSVQRILLRLSLELLAVALPGQRYLRSKLADRALVS